MNACLFVVAALATGLAVSAFADESRGAVNEDKVRCDKGDISLGLGKLVAEDL